MTWLRIIPLVGMAVAFGPPFPPVGPPTNPSGCALIIPGPGRSSTFDGAVFALGGQRPPYTPDNTCITYEAVNAAFATAKDRVGLPPVTGDYEPDDIGQLGSVIHETTRYLAKQYGLSKDAIANGLPLIDTTKTAVENNCPPFLMTPECEVARYRSITGICNNLKNPHWGSAMTAHERFVAPDFADGISAPRASSVNGAPLPSTRLVSSFSHPDNGLHDHAVTIMLVAWGQFIDHDITLTGESKDPATGTTPKCCEGGRKHPNCLPIEIPSNDKFYAQHSQRCMNFVRSPAGLRFNCRLGPRSSLNLISSIIDAGTVYSNAEKTMEELRAFKGGKLKMLPVFEEFGMKPLLPLKLEEPNEGCIRPSEDIYCFLAGDSRVNEQTVLATIHTLFARQHNLMAEEFARINPHWNDETIFQEARHINAALSQHITYNEFLPMLLGKEVMSRHGLILNREGYFDGYNPASNPGATSEFISAAFRLGHSLLPSTIERWSKSHHYIGSQRLSELLQQPYDLYKGGWVDNYIMGLINQVAQAMDTGVTQEVKNHLFQDPGKKWGLDLVAINMQRGRDHGIPSYNVMREFCGFPKIYRFDDLYEIMPNITVAGYKKYYQSPDDIDLWSAGVAEKPLPGSMVGPTFACLVGKQFQSLRSGDRFWYENGGWPSSFTLEQLAEIRKMKLSRIVCDNTDTIDNVQVYAMVLPDHEINPRVSCKSGVLPRLDLTKWRDATAQSSRPFSSPFKK